MANEAPVQTAAPDTSDSGADAFFSNASAEQGISTDVKQTSPKLEPSVPPAKTDKAVAAEKGTKPVSPEKVAEAPKEKKTASLFESTNPKEAPADVSAQPTLDDRFPEPKNLSETGKPGWKAIKEALAKAENESANYRAQAETYKKAVPADTASYESLKSEAQQMRDRLAVLDIESHPDFVAQYVKPRDEAIAAATEILAYNSVEGVNAASLLSLGQKEFNARVADITKDMNDMDKSSVQSELRKAHQLATKAKGAMANSSQLREQLQAKSAAQQKQEFENVFKEIGYQDGYLEPIVPEDASDEDKADFADISASMKGARAKAEEYAFGKITAKQSAQLAAKAAFLEVHMNKVVPRMHKEWSKVTAENKLLREENAGLKKAKSAGNFSGDKAGIPAGQGPSDTSDAGADAYFKANR